MCSFKFGQESVEGLPFGASNWAWEACDDAGGTRVFESASGGKTPVELEKIYENT